MLMAPLVSRVKSAPRIGAASTVATPVAVLDQVPPATASVSDDDNPPQSDKVPEIDDGIGSIVTA